MNGMKNRGAIAMVVYTKLSNDARVLRQVKAAIEAGFMVDVYTLKEPDKVSFLGLNVISASFGQYKGNGKIRYVFSYLRFFFFCFFRVSFNMVEKRYVITQAHNMPNFLVFSFLIPRLLGAKIILDIHDLLPELFAEKFNLSLNHWLIQLIYFEERISGNFADVVISTNRLHTRRFLKNRISKVEFPEILNSADELTFRPFTDHNFDQNPVVIIYPTTMAKRLGLDVLIETLDILVKQKKPVFLKIFGDGEYREKLKQNILQKNLQNHVYVSKGFESFDTLAAELERANIGIIPWPSHYSTNLQMPGKIHEYFIKGLCVVASDLEILKEYFNDCVCFAQAGNPVDLADKISLLIENRDLMKKYAVKGHSFYRENPWSRYKDRYIQILNELATI